MKSRSMSRLCVLLTAAFLFFQPGIAANARESGAFPAITPGDAARKYAGLPAVQTDSWETLAEIALWASGSDAATSAQSMSLLKMDIADLAASPDLPENTRERGEYVLTFIHTRYLKQYSWSQTRLDEILLYGRYNCVSSAVLYMLMAASIGLDVQGVATKDHAFATVRTDTGSIDVETTNRYGFDPGNRKEFHDDFGASTGFAYVPARHYRDRIQLNRLELVSLILSNRIAELERGRNYAAAVPLAVDRAALLEGKSTAAASFFPDPKKDLTDRLLNYGATLLRDGQEEDAFSWAILVNVKYPDPARWEEFNYAALHNLVVKLLRKSDVSAAEAAYERLSSRVSPKNAEKVKILISETLKRQ
ncbi:MAG: hypothetical protein LBS97_05695 [Treponema sp.]|jgi:hypothetical protein|nr:hypothetical protein [Treponema sp.]